MAYSDSTHFSDKFSYKILFISSYGLKDMNLARYKHFLKFQKNRDWLGLFSPRDRKPQQLTSGTEQG
jgi:hypothetical protein